MLNQITIMGRLTKDPYFSVTDYTRIPMVTFSLAVERDVKDKEGNKATDFIDVVAWRGTAEFVQKYFRKGQMMIVTGRLQVNTYETDGEKRKYANVAASSVYFGESKRSDPQPVTAAASLSEAHGYADVSADYDQDFPY